MSESDVYGDEMSSPSPLDDAALDAYFSGCRGPADGFGSLAAFADDVRVATTAPAPATSPDLVRLLREGFSTEKGDLPATAASNVTGPAGQAAGLPKWRKKKMLVSDFLSSLAAKLGALGLAAKLGLGVGVAAAAVTSAGAAGVLPAPAQNVVAGAVNTVTPFHLPEGGDHHTNFGATVSADATGASDGVHGVDGQAVADAARQHAQGAGDGASATGTSHATGLDRANETPAAGHVPTSLPGGGDDGTAPDDGSEGSNGLSHAGDTPAAAHVPTSTPPSDAGSHGSTGLTQAGQTPAAGHVPSSPGRP
jgi:hypothetical protein